MLKLKTAPATFCTVLAILIVVGSNGLCNTHPDDPRQFVQNGGFLVQQYDHQQQYREQELFIPASTIKILTCLVALELLGKDYRFQTHFFLDTEHNLYVKGYGDPFLTSESILEIGQALASKGVERISTIYLDDSSFALNGETAGDENSINPYDAPNGALSVNFNALPILKTREGTIQSGEPHTPVIPLMVEIGNRLTSGFERVNVNGYPQSGSLAPTLQYTGELFSAQFKKVGIILEKGFARKTVPDNLAQLYTHHGSKSLEEIVRQCLKYSNNFIANQLFLACGIQDFGLPATWEKSRRASKRFTQEELGFDPTQIQVEEGSGLSRKNRISPAALVNILQRFEIYSPLLVQDKKLFVKTGTLQDVFCYAGYFVQDEKLVPFAILLNQPHNTRERLLNFLHDSLSSTP